MKKVGIYVRVSTVEQAEKGWSVEGQYREIRAFCKNRKGWKVAWVFRDEGYSAADLNRPGIQNLLDRVQEGKVDIVVVWKYDRLSRDNIDFPVLLHILEKHRVRIVSLNEPSLDYSSPYGEFVVGMLGLIATLERRVLQTRVKMGMRERSRKGLWHGGTPPFGYSYDGDTGKLVVKPEESEAVRRAFDLYLSTECLYATRDALNSELAEIQRAGEHPGDGGFGPFVPFPGPDASPGKEPDQGLDSLDVEKLGEDGADDLRFLLVDG